MIDPGNYYDVFGLPRVIETRKIVSTETKKNDWKVERDYFNLIVIGNCFLADDQELAMSIVDSTNINTCSV